MRPIDADALLIKWSEKARKMARDEDGCIPIDFLAVISAVVLTPTLDDLRPHGRWIISSDGYYPYCSNCKKEPKSGEMTPFCPSCGSKMDLEEDEL